MRCRRGGHRGRALPLPRLAAAGGFERCKTPDGVQSSWTAEGPAPQQWEMHNAVGLGPQAHQNGNPSRQHPRPPAPTHLELVVLVSYGVANVVGLLLQQAAGREQRRSPQGSTGRPGGWAHAGRRADRRAEEVQQGASRGCSSQHNTIL